MYYKRVKNMIDSRIAWASECMINIENVSVYILESRRNELRRYMDELSIMQGMNDAVYGIIPEYERTEKAISDATGTVKGYIATVESLLESKSE